MKSISRREWLPILGMTISAFIFNTSEFMPIGLLSDIAASFSVSQAKAGMIISAYAWAVMLLSLPLMIAASRLPFRRLLLGTVGLFLLGQILSAWSGSYWMLMLARMAVACAHAVFWSIASPIAVRLAAPEHRAFALGMIVTGTSIAMIFGLPLGRIIGLAGGWRMTFVFVAVLAAVLLVYLAVVFPKMSDSQPFFLHELPAMLRSRQLLGIYLLACLIPTAYYTVYSYIEPFLHQVAGLSAGRITTVLMIFGAAGLLGSFSFSKLYDRHRSLFLCGTTVGIAAALLLLRLCAFHFSTIVLLCIFWGMFVTAFNVAFQSEVLQAAPESASAVAMSLFSGIFNLGIGLGTWIGGRVSDFCILPAIGYVGGTLAILGAVYCAFRFVPLLKTKNR